MTNVVQGIQPIKYYRKKIFSNDAPTNKDSAITSEPGKA